MGGRVSWGVVLVLLGGGRAAAGVQVDRVARAERPGWGIGAASAAGSVASSSAGTAILGCLAVNCSAVAPTAGIYCRAVP